MPVLKKLVTKDFLSISRELGQTKEISYEAKGVLIEMLSRPENWIFSKIGFYTKKCHEVKINRIFKELQVLGYLYLYSLYYKGRIYNRIWVVSGEPFSVEEWKEHIKSLNIGNLNLRKPQTEKTSTRENLKLRFPLNECNQDLHNIDIYNINNNINNNSNIRAVGKIKKDCKKTNLSIKYTNEFEEFWAFYPKRPEGNPKKNAFKEWNNLIKQGIETDSLIMAAKNYQIYCNKTKAIGTKYVMSVITFLEKARFEEFININLEAINDKEPNSKSSKNSKQHEWLKKTHSRACEEIDKNKK